MKNQHKFNSVIKLLNQIESKFFRDLIWLIYSDNITHQLIPEKLNFHFSEEHKIEQLMSWYNSIKTLEPIKPVKVIPLGKYAESLIFHYFKNHKEYNLLASNLQLIENNITLGELDYLIENKKNKEFIHLEFAIKFFLKINENGTTKFIGPNTNDKLQNKVEKLTSKQCKLAIDHMELLPDQFQNIEFIPKLCVKGVLFYPHSDWNIESHNLLNSAWWLSIDDIETIKDSTGSFYIVKNKADWIFPYCKNNEKFNYSRLKGICTELLKLRNELMIVRLNQMNQILDRGFIMRSDWPNPNT